MNDNSLAAPLEGNEIVVSAIGSNSLKKTTLYSKGNKNLIAAMEGAGIKRARQYQHHLQQFAQGS